MDSGHSISFQLLAFRNKRSQLSLMKSSPSTHISHSTAHVGFCSSLWWCGGQPRARRCPGGTAEKTPEVTHRYIFSSPVKYFCIPGLSHKNSQPWTLCFFQVGPAESIYKLLWWGGEGHQLSVRPSSLWECWGEGWRGWKVPRPRHILLWTAYGVAKASCRLFWIASCKSIKEKRDRHRTPNTLLVPLPKTKAQKSPISDAPAPAWQRAAQPWSIPWAEIFLRVTSRGWETPYPTPDI